MDRGSPANGSGRNGQEKIVKKKSTLARDWLEKPRSFEGRPSPANNANAVPVVTTSNNKMNTPREGSEAKACTEVSTPERTRKVPSRLIAKAMMARKMVQLFNVSLFSDTMAEWSNAVPTSQGIKDAFSTGSQNHQPPSRVVIGPPGAEHNSSS